MEVTQLRTTITYRPDADHATVTHHHPDAPGLGHWHADLAPEHHVELAPIAEHIRSTLETREYRIGTRTVTHEPVLHWFTIEYWDFRDDLGVRFEVVVGWGDRNESVYGRLPDEHAEHILAAHQRHREHLGLS